MAIDKLPKEKKSEKQPAVAPNLKNVKVEMLYNLSDDIGEQNNLIDNDTKIAQRLKQQLATFEAELRRNLRPAGVESERRTGAAND